MQNARVGSFPSHHVSPVALLPEDKNDSLLHLLSARAGAVAPIDGIVLLVVAPRSCLPALSARSDYLVAPFLVCNWLLLRRRSQTVPPKVLASTRVVDHAWVCAVITMGPRADCSEWATEWATSARDTTRKALADPVANLACQATSALPPTIPWPPQC